MSKQYPKNKLTQTKLKENLHYNPYTGIFVWIKGRANIKAGAVAGSVSKKYGYNYITLNNNMYYAHRLAWLYMEGYFPETDIDHVNRDRNDNRFCNLRVVSRQCNTRNSNAPKNNSSGVIGVSYNNCHNKWVAQIGVNYKRIHLGVFDEKIDAVKARWEAEKKYEYPNCNTTSSAFKYLSEFTPCKIEIREVEE